MRRAHVPPAAWVAMACAALTVAVLVLAARGLTDAADARSMAEVLDLRTPARLLLARSAVDVADPRQALLLCAAAATAACLVATPARAAVVVALLAGAQLSGLALGDCCERVVAVPTGERALLLVASAPSNHTVLATTVAAAIVIAAPRALAGPVTALAAALAAAVPLGLLVTSSHTPVDVVAGWLLAGAWIAAACAVLPAAERRLPARAGRLPLPTPVAGAVLAAGAALLLAVLVARGGGRGPALARAAASDPLPPAVGAALLLAVGLAAHALARRRGAPRMTSCADEE